jgi:hypothetical protein
MVSKLTSVWDKCKTKQLAKIFEDYALSLGYVKWDCRKKDNSTSYYIDGKSENWHRTHFMLTTDNKRDFIIVLRKKAGSYFIIQKEAKRAFEVDYNGIINHDEPLLNQIIEKHKSFFNKLFEIL